MRRPVTAAAEVTLTDAVRLKKTVARYRGRVVLINFWATWCPPCRAEFPALVATQRKYARQGVVLVTVSFDSPEAIEGAVAPFLKRHGVQEGAFVNRDGEAADMGYFMWLDGKSPGDVGLPRTYVLERSGRVTARLLGEQSAAQFDAAVQKALTQR